jgi:hypothetical protein
MYLWMAYVKRIVCLVNSYKPRGRCIAGREVAAKGKYRGWIRPVSDRPKAEVSLSECRYEDNAIPRLLDIVDVPLLNEVGSNPQTENHRLDPGCWWVKKGHLPWNELEQLRDRPPSLWINSEHTMAGVNDCISSEDASTVSNSLLLIKKRNVTIKLAIKYGTA